MSQPKDDAGNQKAPIRLLWLDAENGALRLVRLVFERKDRLIITAANTSTEALRLLKTQAFDLMISDIALKEVDGETFYEEVIAKQYPALQFGFVTFYQPRDTTESSGTTTSGVPFLKKPASRTQLGEMIELLSAKALLPREEEVSANASTWDNWTCHFCGQNASKATLPSPLCESRTCSCGAIALAAPARDWDEITDDAIGLFSVSIRPESKGFEQLLLADIETAGVERHLGTMKGFASSLGKEKQWTCVWFRRKNEGATL